MITESTQEQWDQIEQLKIDIIDQQTQQNSFEDVVDIVHKIYATFQDTKPKVHLVDSPYQALTLSNTLRLKENIKDPIQPYISLWLRVYTASYKAGKILGVEFDEEKLTLLSTWADLCPVVFPTETNCVVSQNPIECHWQDDVLHNDCGPSVKWKDGYALWTINGVQVDEQIVMNPHTQTLEEINSEENVEVKRIRIERYGWLEYLENNNADILDTRKNEIEQNQECLFQLNDMKVLVCSCPSTGRVYSLEVDEHCKSVMDAQEYLSNGLAHKIIGAS